MQSTAVAALLLTLVGVFDVFDSATRVEDARVVYGPAASITFVIYGVEDPPDLELDLRPYAALMLGVGASMPVRTSRPGDVDLGELRLEGEVSFFLAGEEIPAEEAATFIRSGLRHAIEVGVRRIGELGVFFDAGAADPDHGSGDDS